MGHEKTINTDNRSLESSAKLNFSMGRKPRPSSKPTASNHIKVIGDERDSKTNTNTSPFRSPTATQTGTLSPSRRLSGNSKRKKNATPLSPSAENPDFVVMNPQMIKTANMIRYLHHKKGVRRDKRHQRQVLSNGIPCKLNDKGLPIPPSGDDPEDVDPEASGQPYFQVEGDNGEKILYREDSIKKLHNNNSLRYETNMKAFIDEYHDYAVEVHGLIIRNKGSTKGKKVDDTKDFALITNKKDLNKR